MKLKKPRLLPIVIGLGAVLLVIKGEGLVADTAQAARASSAVQQQSRIAADPAADAEPVNASSMDVLTSLSKRRAVLDARERDLLARENLLTAAAKRVDDRIAELKRLQAGMQAVLGQRTAAEQKQLDQLVKSYSSMRPKDAARIFNSLADEVLVPVAAAMKADVLGAILAQMQPEQAQKLTVKLANRLKPQQLAAAAPPPQAASATGAPLAAAPAPQPAAAADEPASPPAARPAPSAPVKAAVRSPRAAKPVPSTSPAKSAAQSAPATGAPLPITPAPQSNSAAAAPASAPAAKSEMTPSPAKASATAPEDAAPPSTTPVAPAAKPSPSK